MVAQFGPVIARVSPAVPRHGLGVGGCPGAEGLHAATLLRALRSSAHPSTSCSASQGSDPSTFCVPTHTQPQLPEEKNGLKLSEDVKKSSSA